MKVLAPLLIVVATIITGCSSSKNTDPSENDPDVLIDDQTVSTIDASPVGLKGVAYTDTETEIFWQEASTNIIIVGYNVVRNGVVLATKLYAKSYYDNTVLPGVSYEYEVVAVDAVGARSEAAVVNVDTPPAYNAVNSGNYLQLIEYVFSIVDGEFTDSSREFVERLYADGPSANENVLSVLLSLVDTGYDEAASQVYMDYNCQQSGTYRSMALGSVYGGGGGKFVQCHIDNEIADGSYFVSESLVKYVYNPGWTQQTTYNLQLSNSTGTIMTELEGVSSENRGQYRNAWSWSVSKFESPSFTGMARITDLFTLAAAGAEALPSGEEPPFERTLESGFMIQSPATGNKVLTISTSELLTTNEITGGYQAGQLLVKGIDNSSMTIQFSNGDTKTFDVIVSTDSTTFTDTLPITEYPLLCVPSGTEENRPHPDSQFTCGL